ncbi:hypothetical protein MRB53_012122 [Persea americana]|uniref:Uncharacterized protein n=1 Tax=Persea americana TaxID=3435 RepID=A0ACC2LWQ9_PERAE|nr:hypothetical protein MRB53_012122 [Persea americana]
MARRVGKTRFVIEPAEAESLTRELSFSSVLETLAWLVESAQKLARPPISNFHVGAVGLASDGRILIGVNLEFPGAPLNQSVHAEQFLATSASQNSAERIEYIAVSAAPCGHCRQFLQEIRGAPEIKILIADKSSEIVFRPLSQLLPQRFGPDDLLDKDLPLLLEPHHNGLGFGSDSVDPPFYSNGGLDRWGELKRAALEAANGAHAPYSGCPSGVAVMDSEGRIFAGSYVESAAYNPSLPPVQAVLVAYVAGGGGAYEEIVAAALVEEEGAVVGQEVAARMLFGAVAPRCDFRVFHCRCLDERKKRKEEKISSL